MTPQVPPHQIEAEDAAPLTVTLLVCPVCGRTDRYTSMSRTGKHYSAGTQCSGKPLPVAYRKIESGA